jgi:uncharacterized protein (DUF433 family)
MPASTLTPTLSLTPAERRRRAKVRRILRLTDAGKSPREIAADAKVRLTPRRVRQILAELRRRGAAGDARGGAHPQ